MNKKILFILLAVVAILPIVASAQTLGSMASSIASVIEGVGFTIVVIAWVITAVLYLTCIGDPGKLKTANMALLASIAGTVVMLLAHGALGLVGRSFGI